jgi:hypothetical protein
VPGDGAAADVTMDAAPDKPAGERRHSRLLNWLLISAFMGIGMSHIPWGEPSGFHGTGFPVFVVAWDRSPTNGQFIDFPNPLGFVLNPLLIFLTGLGAALLFRGLSAVIARSRKS